MSNIENNKNNSALLEVGAGIHIIAVEHGGMMYAGIASVVSPRSDACLGTQAFTEIDDAGELDDAEELAAIAKMAMTSRAEAAIAAAEALLDTYDAACDASSQALDAYDKASRAANTAYYAYQEGKEAAVHATAALADL